MREREQAADHLKVIRSLMERATVYRAISWPTALFGGVLALVISVLLYFREEVAISGGDSGVVLMSEGAWVGCWLVALVVTAAFNAVLILRKCRAESRPFFSPGLKMALRAAIPPMLAGGVIGIGRTLAADGTAAEGAAIWVTCYGLALVATSGFAPKSIPRLGWAFVLTGLAAFAYAWSDGDHPLLGTWTPDHMESTMLEANLIMGLSFGIYHVIYALVALLVGRNGGAVTPRDAEQPGDD